MPGTRSILRRPDGGKGHSMGLKKANVGLTARIMRLDCQRTKSSAALAGGRGNQDVCRFTDSSVARNRGVDFAGPGKNAPGQVVDLLKPVAGKELGGALAAAP